MPGKHKNITIAFRPSDWQRTLIETRAALSGLYKKDFIARSCIYSNIVVVGKRENIKRIVDSMQEMKFVLEEIAGQIKSGDFSLSDNSYKELKRDYLAFLITAVDIVNGAAYLFEKSPDSGNRRWKPEEELRQLWDSVSIMDDDIEGDKKGQ